MYHMVAFQSPEGQLYFEKALEPSGGKAQWPFLEPIYLSRSLLMRARLPALRALNLLPDFSVSQGIQFEPCGVGLREWDSIFREPVPVRPALTKLRVTR